MLAAYRKLAMKWHPVGEACLLFLVSWSVNENFLFLLSAPAADVMTSFMLPWWW
jgi:hypothetical protein